MKILADQNIPFVKDAFGDLGTVVTIDGRRIDRSAAADTDILLVRSVTRVDRRLLEATSVRFVGTATIGTDHVDIAYLRSRSIGFAGAPGCNAESVAQYVASALLHTRPELGPLRELTMGVVGVGNVGRRVVRVASALGMRCLLNDPPRERAGERGAYVSLQRLLSESDIVTLHVPLTHEGDVATYHLVDESFLSKMKPGAALINTSRGAVIDETALRRMRSRLGTVVLDVWEQEPLVCPETVALADIATPHIAGYSLEGKVRGTEMLCRAVHSFFGRQANWDGTEVLKCDPAPAVDLRGSPDPLLKAVASVYPIHRDDAQFRDVMSRAADLRGALFDKLRREYPVRREFSACRITGIGTDDGVRAALNGLGFCIQEGE